jgi:phosphatidylglycerol---prolipoprotein diacylglyceryl transferase
MYPVLFSFKFPEFIGRLSWIEIVLTVTVIGVLFLWRRRGPYFSLPGFLVGVAIYAGLRALVWHAGAGYLFQLHTYGLLIATGFVLGIVLAVRQAGREYLDPNLILDLSFWILIAAMVGSRVLYIVVNINDYLADPVSLLKVWTGGLVFYGGFIGAVATSWYFCQRKGLSFLRISDVMIPSVALGHFFGRLGCYSAGCCHGSTTGSSFFGSIYTAPGTVVAHSHLLNIPIHPTPLYEALGELSIFGILLWLRKRKSVNGQLLAAWLVMYPVWRFMTEMFRGDIDRGILFPVDILGDSRPDLLSTSQVVSVGLFGLGIFLWLKLRKGNADKHL